MNCTKIPAGTAAVVCCKYGKNIVIH